MNQELFEKHPYNQGSYNKKYRVPQLSSETEVSIAFSVSNVQFITQQYESR